MNYEDTYKELEDYAKRNGIKHYEICETSCEQDSNVEYKKALMFIMYYDEKHTQEAGSFCVEVKED